MIAFGICAGPSDKSEKIALPGIEAVREPDSRVIVMRNQRSIFRAYNAIVDQARDAEALVLIHDDVRLLDSQTCNKVRAVMAADVAVVGVIGASGVTSPRWWNHGFVGRANVLLDGEHIPILGNPASGTHEVDAVDGIFLALSPWAVLNLRFDARRYTGFDGYDSDICAQARAAGRRVLVTDIDVVHENSTGLARHDGEVVHEHPGIFRDGGASFRRAELIWRSKWEPMSPLKRALCRARSGYAA